MCNDCGCGDPEVVPVEVHDRILADNDRQAHHNRVHFREAGVLAVNLMGSPGAGKTALLEATARAASGLSLRGVSGDLATAKDAERLEKAGIPARAITTGSACHLDARMVHEALHDIPIAGADVFFIENVGNLVCPAIYDLGQQANVVVISVTEGDDKPEKYPIIFRGAELVVLTKIDLLPHLPGFDIAAFEASLAHVMPEPRWIAVSAFSGAGMSGWVDWLLSRRSHVRA